MGEADLFEPWNDNDSAERIDASAFQDLANPELYTRRLSLIRNLQSNRPEFDCRRIFCRSLGCDKRSFAVATRAAPGPEKAAGF